MTEYLYRYTDEEYCGVSLSPDGIESYYSVGPKLKLHKYRIIKRTPCGAWISLGYPPFSVIDNMHRKFVNLKANKQFACETEERALESFYARKRRQIKILRAQLRRAERAVELKPEGHASLRLQGMS